MSGLNEEALQRVRLDARHGRASLSRLELDAYCQLNAVRPDDVRQAERQGRALLANGSRCLCPSCDANVQALDHNQRLRIHYSARRHAQLEAAGISNWAERERVVQGEIDAGAAMQAAPVRITRNGAST